MHTSTLHYGVCNSIPHEAYNVTICCNVRLLVMLLHFLPIAVVFGNFHVIFSRLIPLFYNKEKKMKYFRFWEEGALKPYKNYMFCCFRAR